METLDLLKDDRNLSGKRTQESLRMPLDVNPAALNSLRFAPQTQLPAKGPDTAAEAHDGQTCGKHCQDGEVKHAIVSLAPGCCSFPFPSAE